MYSNSKFTFWSFVENEKFAFIITLDVSNAHEVTSVNARVKRKVDTIKYECLKHWHSVQIRGAHCIQDDDHTPSGNFTVGEVGNACTVG